MVESGTNFVTLGLLLTCAVRKREPFSKSNIAILLYRELLVGLHY